MAEDPSTEFHLEIAHILFIDTVGYSKLLTKEQRESQGLLNKIVRASERFHTAEAAGKLIRLPTGDGMALVFTDGLESPILCALEICRTMREHPGLQVRMGIHSGPVTRVVDVNDRSNFAGAGMNMAERVMSCGDASHILLSKRAAEDLAEYDYWRPYLHDLGECEGKHGAKLSVFNFYTEEFGNPEPPRKFKKKEHPPLAQTPPVKYLGSPWPMVGAVLLLSAAIFALYFFFHHPVRRAAPALSANGPPGAEANPIPEKSIAVLPFDNLGADKEEAQFAEGVHDEILTDLAKVADLKVISRTSVMQYGGGSPRNLREIAKALGAAHVVEGTVQRENNRVRVSAQLIDARTDTHLWADRYDRDLADVFALESELAETIVAQLAATLSPQEKAAIEEKPTDNLAAYDLYSRATALMGTLVFNTRSKDNLYEAARLLDRAVALDPTFLRAYCRLARAHDLIYFLALDHTPARLALANAAVEAALRLRPNSGEARLALAHHWYCGYLDYDRARAELLIAGRLLPNEPLVFELLGYINRRQGRWEESIRDLRRALTLDPRNAFLFQQIALTYSKLRRYAEMADALDHALLLVPNDVGTRIQRGSVEMDWHGDLKPLQELIPRILSEDPNAAGELAQIWFIIACYERDAAEISRAIAAMPADGCHDEGVAFPHTWCEGVAARTTGDLAAAQADFTAARAEQEKIVRNQPQYGQALCVLGMIDAGLGRKKEAIEEGRRAIELLPLSKDSINGAVLIQYLAIIYAWTGEKDLALKELAFALRIPGDLSYAQLRWHPYWDPLRGDTRFERIVASLAPGDVGHAEVR